jgi:hypothetical protein
MVDWRAKNQPRRIICYSMEHRPTYCALFCESISLHPGLVRRSPFHVATIAVQHEPFRQQIEDGCNEWLKLAQCSTFSSSIVIKNNNCNRAEILRNVFNALLLAAATKRNGCFKFLQCLKMIIIA